MEFPYVVTPEQARRLAERAGGAVSIKMKRERFVQMGLGLGLGEQSEARISINGREGLWHLVRIDMDPNEPGVVGTAWLPDAAPAVHSFAEAGGGASAFPEIIPPAAVVRS